MTRDELRALASSSGGLHASVYAHVDLDRNAWETRARAAVQQVRRTPDSRELDLGALEELLFTLRPGRYVCALISANHVRPGARR